MLSGTDYEKLKQIIIFSLLFLFIIVSGKKTGLFEPKYINGNGYKMDFPVGWVKNKEFSKRYRDEEDLYETEVFTYETPERNPKTGEPEATLEVYSKKLPSAAWLEDEWGDIIHSIRRARFKILDKGEIKIDGEIFKWAIFHDRKRTVLIIEFYHITEGNMFYKIRYYADPRAFPRHRPAFEAAKESFRLKLKLL